MQVKDTEAARKVRDVVASMAIEDMYLESDYILKLIEVADGKRKSENLINEVISQYARQ